LIKGLLFLVVCHYVGLDWPSVIAGELEGSWRAGGQQEGLQYNGEAAWWKVIVIYCISADEKKLKLASPKRS
jgi:hypothetical protein